jgi:hypothetical protein
LIGGREVGVTSEVERRDGERKRRSGGRGKASGKRRRNGQPVDDKKSFVGNEGGSLLESGEGGLDCFMTSGKARQHRGRTRTEFLSDWCLGVPGGA